MAWRTSSAFDHATFSAGAMTPIWFGSAINSWRARIDGGHCRIRPCPTGANRPSARDARGGQGHGVCVRAQANMDPKHRDRVAFIRLASGHF